MQPDENENKQPQSIKTKPSLHILGGYAIVCDCSLTTNTVRMISRVLLANVQ